MNFIIFDLEATCWENSRDRTQEIIEIGAVKINEYAEVISSFSRFVRPTVHPLLSPFCMNLTGIRQLDVNRAATFDFVIEDFQDWIEIFEEEFLLCSWGGFDKKMLALDCQRHDLEDDWTEHHINLKDQYRDIRSLSKAVGLRRAVENEGFDFDGNHHRAIDDAVNLTKIFRKFFDIWRY